MQSGPFAGGSREGLFHFSRAGGARRAADATPKNDAAAIRALDLLADVAHGFAAAAGSDPRAALPLGALGSLGVAAEPLGWHAPTSLQTAIAGRLARPEQVEGLSGMQVFEAMLAGRLPAPPIGQATMEMDGVPVSVRKNLGAFTQPISYIGLPVVAAPVNRPCGLDTATGAPAKRR